MIQQGPGEFPESIIELLQVSRGSDGDSNHEMPVALMTYKTGAVGFSFHPQCSSVYHAEHADNHSEIGQADGRIRRIMRIRNKKFVEVLVEGTLHEEIEARLIRKLAPFMEAMGAVAKANEIYAQEATADELALVMVEYG